jgi:hypothetical protein
MDIPIFETDNSISAKAFRDGYELGKSNVKSSLKRDIEKRIVELEQIALVSDQWNKIDIQISECKRFLELIETVEP